MVYLVRKNKKVTKIQFLFCVVIVIFDKGGDNLSKGREQLR